MVEAVPASLVQGRGGNHIAAMWSREQWRNFFDRPWVEWAMFAGGLLLIVAGFALAPLPGPGGIFLIAPGLALVLKSSMWAKRHYVRVKRWQPRAGKWLDWSLRRKSAARRDALRKARESDAPAYTESGNGN